MADLDGISEGEEQEASSLSPDQKSNSTVNSENKDMPPEDGQESAAPQSRMGAIGALFQRQPTETGVSHEDGEVVVPASIMAWQLLFDTGWGPYLCLPVTAGACTRSNLASTLEDLLQSTLRPEEPIRWHVTVVSGAPRLQFSLVCREPPTAEDGGEATQAASASRPLQSCAPCSASRSRRTAGSDPTTLGLCSGALPVVV
ncbi:hypothetical protein T484DRAFT_1912432, partial [Baffinella frigidus]